MALAAHKVQLLVCHQRISGRRRPGGHISQQYCDLSAYAWCFTCEHYVCDIHLHAMHAGHATQVEFEDNTTRPGDFFD